VAPAEAFKIWYQTEPPSPSWTAYKRRQTGTLTINGDHAEFQPKKGSRIVISDVRSVSKGWKNQLYGKPLLRAIDTYIEVAWGDPTNPSVAFINDGRLFGLCAYLPHRRMQQALTELVQSANSDGQGDS
jgi:hypothetical protein